MERVPEEVILQIVGFLEVNDLICLQSVSHRFLNLSRDNTVWKSVCFYGSRAESLRRRQQIRVALDPRLDDLRNAVSALPGGELTALEVAQLQGVDPPRASSHPASEARIQQNRSLINWEPGYPGEKLNYYEEYIHRCSPISVGWLNLPNARSADKEALIEATGMGTMKNDDGQTNHVVAPLDDGSICVWDVSPRGISAFGGGGRMLGRSKSGLLSARPAEAVFESHTIMTETGAVECVAINSSAQKGYFAVQSLLQEVDLNTLQLVSTSRYPFSITALSEARLSTPITVGTNMTIHLHDPREPAFGTSGASNSGELIGGSVYSHATLAQPGPLSILHHGDGGDDGSIWVGGRFTSLLNYDRRFFPRLRGTQHSGARIACLSSIPYPYIPRSMDLVRNQEASVPALLSARNQPGATMLAAAEYKGKGSLEMYGLPRTQEQYQNRQTASASKLLSVAPHGGRIVFSDGDGHLKWVERDGFSHVRAFDIADSRDKRSFEGSPDAPAYGIWESTASQLPGQGDIVQKIIPCVTASETLITNRADVNQSNLLLWTGDGAIGMLGFGHRNPLEGGDDDWHDAVESHVETAEQKAREDAERQYAGAMRRALERNADEVRFVRGLGMGFRRN